MISYFKIMYASALYITKITVAKPLKVSVEEQDRHFLKHEPSLLSFI